mmetsp:Transcript_10890/g.35827  ORF Transcript_10890/g.35827 Transcript_10890/m.35827 type:complete len:440 (+) Transcript_10890:207-1526(+)
MEGSLDPLNMDADPPVVDEPAAAEPKAEETKAEAEASIPDELPKDPNAPRKPMTAFMLFATQERPIAAKNHPSMTIQTLAKHLSLKFKQLPRDDKEEWDLKASQDQERYNEEFEVYKTTEQYAQYMKENEPILKKMAAQAKTAKRQPRQAALRGPRADPMYSTDEPKPKKPKKEKKKEVYADPPPPEEAIGWKVKVYWTAMDKYYPGRVAEYDAETGSHTVYYNDGDIVSDNLFAEDAKVHWLAFDPSPVVKPEPKPPPKPKGEPKRKRPAARTDEYDSADDDDLSLSEDDFEPAEDPDDGDFLDEADGEEEEEGLDDYGGHVVSVDGLNGLKLKIKFEDGEDYDAMLQKSPTLNFSHDPPVRSPEARSFKVRWANGDQSSLMWSWTELELDARVLSTAGKGKLIPFADYLQEKYANILGEDEDDMDDDDEPGRKRRKA